MKIIKQHIFYGPNIYAPVPIVINSFIVNPSSTQHLIPILEYMCDTYLNNYKDDLVPKTNDSTYLIKLFCKFSFELINQHNGILEFIEVKQIDNQIIGFIEFESLEVTLKAIQVSIKILNLLIHDGLKSQNIDKILDSFTQFAKFYHAYDKNLLLKSKQLNIPSFQYINTNPLYRQYGWGENSRIFRMFSPMEDGYHGVNISMDKLESKKLLRSIGMPIAKHVVVENQKQLEEAIKQIGFPCVIKPVRGSQGIGITANIKNFSQLEKAYQKVKKSQYGQHWIMLEEFIEGSDYRIVVVEGKCIGCFERLPTTICGNGSFTVKELIQEINIFRDNQEKNTELLKVINIDSTLVEHLETQDVSLNTILKEGKQIFLSSVSNYSAGGTIGKILKELPKEVCQIAETIAEITKIDVLGIDYISKDIQKPYCQGHGAITEFNHYIDSESLNLLETDIYPLEKCSRIQVDLIIIDKDSINSIENLLEKNDNASLGWCTNKKIYVGKLPLNNDNVNGWERVKVLLRQKTLSKAIIVCSVDEIITKGLPLDKFNTIHCIRNIDKEWYKVLEASSYKVKTFEHIEQVFKRLKKELCNE